MHNPIRRREFLETIQAGSVGALAGGLLTQVAIAQTPESETEKKWEPVSDRKIRFGIVGHGVCEFGAAFGFQDHPNVEIVDDRAGNHRPSVVAQEWREPEDPAVHSAHHRPNPLSSL